MVRFWDPAYQCFTFNQEDMTPTIEEYAALLRIDNVQFGKIYVKEPKPLTFRKNLRESVLSHPDILKRVNLFALAIYGLVIFPRVLGHIEAKTRSQPCPDYLSRDIQVLEYLSKGWKGTIYRMCTAAQRLDFESFLESRAHSIPHVFKNIRPARSLPQERVAERNHRATLGISVSESSRRGYNVESTLDPSFSFAIQMWKPRLGTFTRLWGGVGYAPLLVQRQFSSRQFIPATGGLVQSEFAFTGEGYMKKIRDTARSWNEIHFMELALYADTLTQDYDLWRKQRGPQYPSRKNYQLKIEVQVERSRTEKVQREAELSGRKKLATSREEGILEGKSKERRGKAARAAIELRRKNAEYEMALRNLRIALEEKNDQYDRDMHAYEGTLQEREMQLNFLINEIRQAAMQVVQLSDEAEVLSCQFPPSQRSSISEFLEQVKKQGNVARKFV
ncbi:hypothetical protein CXB51_028749 [Gossypium anomalum]|uniref:Uncharacterized protein n=1 Tax=Gossypium anomalum TaxID=47600 RepID=A0A8J5XYJ8_9ROSI|nr:hypothetical protein CXB51_028749 [Gossypium anomalum]